jgi:sterol desaturase/sphingolipid hydroxylase (fatty acid hydroxylase superfamily)
MEIWNFVKYSFLGYGNYLLEELIRPSWNNYFYALIFISLAVWLLEVFFPWRKNQGIFRKDFWMDTFYMFFNFFIFNLLVFIALSSMVEALFLEGLFFVSKDLDSLQLINLNDFPFVFRLVLFFVITDYIQWRTHRLLHKSAWLWTFHKVHHSVKEMGFAAHLRYHWMETLVYKTVLYIPLAIIGGFQVDAVVFVHLMTLTIGHLNHANIKLSYGPLKYIFNNPEMHIWHHAKAVPENHSFGVNFGISLSIWDYIFKTSYIPESGRDIELGFEGDETFPTHFIHQEIYPLHLKK